MIAEAIFEVVVLLWDPPSRLMGRVWARVRGRSLPLRAGGVLLCSLIAAGSVAIWFAAFVLILAGPVFLALELL